MKTVSPTKQIITDRVTEEEISYVSDAELLSLFLRARDGVNSLDRARALLNQRPLIDLLRAPYSTQLRAFGISKRQLAQIQAGMELAKRSVMATELTGDALTSPNAVREYLSLQLAGRQQEIFCGIFLDNRHRVLCYKEMSYGTIDSAAVYPREILKHCLSCNAAAIIFCHNHPSGVAEPSDTDVRLTRKLIDALALVDIRALDHLIVGQGVVTSLAERGLM